MRRLGRYGRLSSLSALLAVGALVSASLLSSTAVAEDDTGSGTVTNGNGPNRPMQVEPAGRPARGSDKGDNPGGAGAQAVRQRPAEDQAIYDQEKDAATEAALANPAPDPGPDDQSNAGPLAPVAGRSWNGIFSTD